MKEITKRRLEYLGVETIEEGLDKLQELMDKDS